MRYAFSNLFQIALIVAVATWTNTVLSEEVRIDFENAEIGKPTSTWTDKEVVFELAQAPAKSKAQGRVTFFPHIGTDRKGILNAMAEEAIPLRIKFPASIRKATLTLWGSTSSAVIIEAFDRDGKLIDKAELEKVPSRRSPEELVPFFDLSVEAASITTIHISGAKPGGYVALDDLRFVYEESQSNSSIPVSE